MLVDRGAEVGAKANNGWTALHFAAQKGGHAEACAQFPCVVQFAFSNLQWHIPASSSRRQDVLVLHVYLETAHHGSKPFKSNPEELQAASLTACFSVASSDSKVTVCISSVDGTHLGVALNNKLMDLAKPRTVELRNQDGILMTVSLLSRRAVGVKPKPLKSPEQWPVELQKLTSVSDADDMGYAGYSK